MHYEFEILDSLVLDKLRPSFAFSLPDESLAECLSIALTEKSRIKRNLYKSVFELKEDRLIEIYIHNHQKRLIFLADNLHDYLNSNRQSSDKQTIISECIISAWESLYPVIEELLFYIESHFSKYVNPNEKIPERLKQTIAREFQECLLYIDQFRNTQNAELISIATNPVVKFIDNQQVASFRQLSYLKELIKQYWGFEKQSKENDYGVYLKNSLFYINFNTLSFLHFLIDEILQELDLMDSVPDKIERLSWYLKTTNQSHVHSDFVYKPKSQSIKELLLHWIEDEIYHLEKSLKTFEFSKQAANSLVNSSFKLETDLTVNQYAFLIRVFAEVGIYKNKSKTKLADFFAVNTNTKGADIVSSRNLRNNLYGTDENDREVIKNVAIKILNYIQGLKVIIPLLYILQGDMSLIWSIIPLTA